MKMPFPHSFVTKMTKINSSFINYDLKSVLWQHKPTQSLQTSLPVRKHIFLQNSYKYSEMLYIVYVFVMLIHT